MFIKLLAITIVLLSSFGCALSPSANDLALVTSTPTPYVFDEEKARDLADKMVNAFIKNDRPIIFSTMEKAARDQYDQATFNDIIDKMVEMYGSPIEAEFKKAEQGRKRGEGGYNKPMRKYWYKVRTSKFEYDSHYIFVEIVPDGDGYASSGIAIVNFPMGVPDDMQ